MKLHESKPRVVSPSTCFVRWLAHPVTLAVLLATATLVLYWPATRYDFISLDDPVYVTENPQVLRGLSREGMRWAFTTTEGGSWHPLTWISLMVDAEMWGVKAGGFHAVNVLLHIVNVALLFGLLRRMTGVTWCSAFVAALFACHPLHVESVAWISERKDVLSTLFWLSTLGAYTGYATTAGGGIPQAGRRRKRWWYALTLISFTLGLASKPMLVTLPLVMLLLDFWPLQRWKAATCWKLGQEKIPFFVLSAVACVVTIWAQQQGGAISSLTAVPLSARIENGLVAYASYLGKTFWPAGLSVFYPRQVTWGWLPSLSAAGLLLGITVTAWCRRRQQPFLLTGWLWFLGTLVPVIGIVQVGAQAMADRYTYVPLIGVFIAISWTGGQIATSPRARGILGVVAGGILILCGIQTSNQVQHWRNSGTLFRHALAVTKSNELAHNNLAGWLIGRGEFGAAADQSRFALQINPESIEALNNLGVVLAAQGRGEESVELYRQALSLQPDNDRVLNSLGLAFAQQGKWVEAAGLFERSLQIRPHHEVLNNLGLAFLLQGQPDKAAAHFRRALELHPGQPQVWNNLGVTLGELAQHEAAAGCFERAIRIHPDYAEAHARLGQVLIRLGRDEEARRRFEEAVRLQPENAEFQKLLQGASP